LLHVLWHIWLYHCLIRHPENKRKLSKTDKYFIITDKSLLKRNGTYQSIYMFYLIFSVWRGELVGFVPSIIMWRHSMVVWFISTHAISAYSH
jgi:hypothetical protein